MFENVTHVLWDWNGTLVDDVQVNLRVVKLMLEDRGLPSEVSAEFYREHFRFPVIDFYRDVGFSFESEPFDHAAEDYVRLYAELFPETALYGGALKLLNRLHDAGISQVILSATKLENLRLQVEHFGVADLFHEILGVSDSRGNGKVSIGERWLRENGVNPESIVMIGDTVHDSQVAEALGCRCILVASGHQSRAILEKTSATVVDSLRELC